MRWRMMKKNIERVIDWGLASENENKIIKFLNKIYSTPLEKPESWEKEIFSFFSKEVIVPYIICTSIKDDDNEMMENIKKSYFKTIINHSTVIWNSNDCYKDLIKIKESLDVGKKIKDYLEYFFIQNHHIRRMFIKRVDEEDLRFNNFKVGITPICCELKKDNKIIGYENTYFIFPDTYLDYPIKVWHNKISKEWRIKLKNKFNNKIIKKRDPIDSKLRHECFKRDNYKCVECAKTKEKTTLHCDHIIPVSQGGFDELNNLQTLCQACNLAKSNKCWKKDNGE